MLQKEIQLAVEKGEMLPLMEEFYTIQGEGYHTGTAAYFIRIGGCDVGCHWCDVKESWNAELHPPTETDIIVSNAKKYSDTVVITGGEPLTWDMNPLTQKLKSVGINIHIETSGCYPVTGKWDWFCLDNVLYHGNIITILWDKTGEKYKKGKGFRVFKNGKEIAFSEKLERVISN